MKLLVRWGPTQKKQYPARLLTHPASLVRLMLSISAHGDLQRLNTGQVRLETNGDLRKMQADDCHHHDP